MENKKTDRLSFLRLISKQIKTVIVHIINLLSNILGNDYISCRLRKFLFETIGANIGKGTTLKGGGYLYGGGLITGENCHINRNCYFDFTEKISLGDCVSVGHGVSFITAKHSIGDSSCRAGKVTGLSISVEDGVWIGANVTILPGISIKQGAIVAAGALVAKDVPANVVVAGVPAKIIKSLPLQLETK